MRIDRFLFFIRLVKSRTLAQTVIETGPLRLVLRRDGFDPFGEVSLDRNADGQFLPDERITAAGDLFVRDAQGRRFTAAQAPDP